MNYNVTLRRNVYCEFVLRSSLSVLENSLQTPQMNTAVNYSTGRQAKGRRTCVNEWTQEIDTHCSPRLSRLRPQLRMCWVLASAAALVDTSVSRSSAHVQGEP